VIAMTNQLDCESSTLSCTIANLTSGYYYTFTVVAINRVGRSTTKESAMIRAGSASGTAPATATNMVSFFGGDPVRVRGTISCCTVENSVMKPTGTLTTDKFSATVGTVVLTDVILTWRAAADGENTAGWSGTAKVVIGFGITVSTKITSYTGPQDWTLTALATTNRLAGKQMVPGVNWPSMSFGGTVSNSNGTIIWAFGATVDNIVLVPGVLKLTTLSFSVSNACPTLPNSYTYVCPRGVNSMYLVATAAFELTVASRAYTANGYFVYGLTSNTLTMAVKLGNINLGSGVTLTGPLFQAYMTTAVPTPGDKVLYVNVPGAPWSVSATTVLADGSARVTWITPPNNGGSPVLGYSVVATPVPKADDTTEHAVVTCVSGPGNYTVTREPVKKTGTPAANPTTTKRINSTTNINTFCAFEGLDYGTEYTYTVTAFNAVGQGLPGVSTKMGSVSILGALKGASFFAEISGGVVLTDLGLTLAVKAMMVPLGSDGKALTDTNGCSSATANNADGTPNANCTVPRFGWAIVANIASDSGAKKSMLKVDAIGTLAYFTMDATVVLDGITENALANSFVLGATMTLTDDMKKVLPGVDTLKAVIVYKPVTFEWKVSLKLSTGWKTKIGAVTLDFLRTEISVSGTAAVPQALTLLEYGTVTIANKDGSTTVIQASLGLTIEPTGVVIAITALGLAGQPVWPNMFGYKGFNLMSMSLNVGYVGGFPELGLGGTVELPANMMKVLGGDASTTITVAANLSAANPCIAVDVAATDGVSNVLNIASGTITASKVAFAIAPFGCTIGAGDFAMTYPQGVSFAFSGSFMKLRVAASFSIITSDLWFTISGSISVGAITLGSLVLDSTLIEISLGSDPASAQTFKFSGGATMFGTKLSVSAAANWLLDRPYGDVTATVSVSRMTIGGFGLQDVYATFSLSSTNPQNFEIGFGAKIPILPGAMIAATGKITPTQVYVNVNATINWGSFAVVARGNVYLGAANGSTIYTASLTVGLRILDQDLSASLVISTDVDGAHYSVEYALGFAPFGTVKLTLYADCSWAGFPNAAVMGGRIAGRFNFGVLSGSFAGSASLGSNASGTPTLLVDFTVTATLGITWVANVSATVRFYNCSSNCTRFATPVLQLRASTTWLGNAVDTGWQSMSIDGTFSITASSSFSRSSGIVYGCLSCSDPGSEGLLRWQASFSGSASFTFSSSGGLGVSTSASAEIQQSASKGTCTHKTLGVCDKVDYSWGSFTKLANMNINIDLNSGSLKGRYAGRDYSA